VRFSVLGPLRVAIGGREAPVGGPRQRLVLALLVARADQVVQVDELIDGVWGDDLPGRPRKTLQVYVSNLRSMLGAQAIESEPSGYRLAVDRDQVDALRAADLVDEARRAARGDPVRAVVAYDAALALWRGEPYADVPASASLVAVQARLGELRLAALEERAALDLVLGRAARVVDEMEALVDRHPLRERAWALLMQALYVGGRQADALAAYQRARARLVEDLGVEPSPELRAMERRVLAHDPALAPGRPPSAPAPEVPGPHPAPPPGGPDGPARPPRAAPAERRQVTAVCCGLTGVEEDLVGWEAEEVAELVERFDRTVRDTVERWGGEVRGSVGAAATAWFGLPGSDGGPIEAVRAALATVAAVAGSDWGDPHGRPLGPAVRIGVDTGWVITTGDLPTPAPVVPVPPVGGVRAGAPPAGDGPADAPHVGSLPTGTGPVGEASLRADRLRHAARPGEVLVSERTADLVRGYVELGAPADRSGAGGTGAGAGAVVGVPVAGDACVDERIEAVRSVRPVTLFGRDRPLAALVDALAGADAGQVVAVVGEPGAGKSALVAALVERVTRRPGHVALVARCRRRRRDVPLHPFGARLARAFASHEELSGRLAALGDDDPALARALAELAGLAEPDETRPAADAAGAVLRWLALRAQGRRLVLVVEDLHDVDAATRALLAELIEGPVPDLVVVVTSRDDVPAELAPALRATVPLGPLAPADARRLVRSLPGARALGIAVVNEIVERAGRVPLHVEELTLATLARGAPPAPGAGPAGPAGVPPSLRTSLIERLDGLGAAKATAVRCATLGVDFDVELACLVADDEPAVVAGHLAQLAEASVLVQVGVEPAVYRFRHALVEEAAYAALVRDDRVALHRRLVEAHERRRRFAPGELATHLAASGRTADAARAWCTAARQANERGHAVVGAGQARQALATLRAVPAGSERDELELNAGALLAQALEMTVGADDELSDLLARCSDLADRLERADLLAVIYPMVVGCLQGLGSYRDAESVGQAGLALAAGTGLPGLDRALRLAHGATLVWRGEVRAGESLVLPALGLPADEHGGTGHPGAPAAAVTAGSWALAGLAAWVQGRPARADERFARARRVAVEADSPQARCVAGATEAIARQLAGDAEGTFRLAERTLALAVELGNDWWTVWSQVLVGWSTAASGNPGAGAAMIAEGLANAGAVRRLRPYFLGLAAQVDVAAGRPDRALALVEEALELAVGTGEGFFLPELLRVQGTVLGCAGGPGGRVADLLAAAERHGAEQGQTVVARRARRARARLPAGLPAIP
jgi:DNA-binding SARP family transcriptional activator/class 3 adenylate cyclase